MNRAYSASPRARTRLLFVVRILVAALIPLCGSLAEAVDTTWTLDGNRNSNVTIQTDAGATLNLSAATQDSDAMFLNHDGTGLNLGARHILVGSDYTNGNFGSGNSSNERANVTGTGEIRGLLAMGICFRTAVHLGEDFQP
jgi:hypothetical protein